MRSLQRPKPPGAAWRRAGAAGGAVLAALLGHMLLLQALWPAPAPAPTAAAAVPRAPAALQLVAPSAPTLAHAAPPAAAALPAATQAAQSRPAPRRAVATALTAATATPAIPAAPSPETEHAPPPGAPAAPHSDMAPASAAAPPVYATRLPDAANLHYQLQRGAAVGTARLSWQRGEQGYELRLDSSWPGQPAVGSSSRGLLDPEGIAPLRHAELRRAREQRAVNFQREIGRISFSGPQIAYALPPGAQDRLSWMIQLPAIVEADAALARAGRSVTLFIAGTRGDAEAWRFEVLGHEALALPAGAVPQALRLTREPTRPYDTRIDVWLDPARQHLPVRAVFTTLPGGVPLQMELAEPPPGLEMDAAGPR